ncbi:MAG: hypothetical protein S4CHLAM7_05580 [Chlamydiae bacterium]|nr:hypothetical protein [Chlamydiota bacterium]
MNFQFFDFTSVFSICAWTGSAVYLLLFLLSLLGAVDSDSLDGISDHGSDHAFQFFSLNTIFGFLMMFGWGGLAGARQFAFSSFTSILIGVVCGIAFLVSTRYLFKSAKKMMSRGTIFNIQNSVGKQAKVYQAIRENKRGVVQVIIDDFCRELDAVSIDNREIPSFQSVEIIKIIDNKTVIVRRVK